MSTREQFPLVGVAVAFAAGAVAQGIPFTVVAVHLDARGDGAGWIAAASFTRLVPYVVCSSFAGAAVARWSVRPLFVASGVARAMIALGLFGALRIDAPREVLLVLLFLMVAAGTPTFPALMRAVRDVPEAGRHRVATMAAGLEAAAFWVGPAIGGLTIAAGVANGVLVSAALAASSAAAVRHGSWLPTARAHDERPRAVIRRAAGSLCDRRCRSAVTAVLAVNVLIGLLGVLLVQLVDRFDVEVDRVFGALSLLQGVGAVAVFAVLVGPRRPHRHPVVPFIAALAAVMALGATDRLAVASAACVAFGAASLASEVVVSASVSEHLLPELVGPAFGLLDTAMVTAMLVGTAAAPPLAELVGVDRALIATAVAAALVMIGVARGSSARGRVLARRAARHRSAR